MDVDGKVGLDWIVFIRLDSILGRPNIMPEIDVTDDLAFERTNVVILNVKVLAIYLSILMYKLFEASTQHPIERKFV